MARLALTIGARYAQHGHSYVVRQVLPDTQFLVEDETVGTYSTVTLSDVLQAWQSGALSFLVVEPQGRSDHATCSFVDYTQLDFQALPEAYRAEAWRRYQLLLPLLRLPRRERTRQALEAYSRSLSTRDGRTSPERHRQALGHATSRASLQRWLAAFEASDGDIRALVPAVGRSGRHGKRLDATLEQLLETVLAECAAAPAYRTGQDVYLLLLNRITAANQLRAVDEQLPLPSPATLYRRIEARGVGPVLRPRPSYLARQAQRAVHEGPVVSQILERVEIDHTVLDLFLVDEEDRLPIGRPTLTTALDIYSGLPLGCFVGFEPPSYRAVMQCLLHAIPPKLDVRALYGTANPWLAYGVPQLLVVDGGKEFVGRDLEDACAQLGIMLDQAPPRMPWYKGAVERHFRSNNTGLIHTLPGTTFSSVLQRGDYDPTKHACLSLRAFWQILHLFLVDFYAQRWHEGMEGIPARRWQEQVAAGVQPTLPPNLETLRILLFRTQHRTLQRCGIAFEALVYQSAELIALRSRLSLGDRQVRIKYDPGDLSALLVATPEGRWLRVPAINQQYAAGLSLWKHRMIRQVVLEEKKTVNLYALMEAKQRIQTIVESEFAQGHRSKTRKQAARFLEIGTGPAPSVPLPDASMSRDHAVPPAAEPALVASSTEQADAHSPPVPAAAEPLDTTGFSSDFCLPRKELR